MEFVTLCTLITYPHSIEWTCLRLFGVKIVRRVHLVILGEIASYRNKLLLPDILALLNYYEWNDGQESYTLGSNRVAPLLIV